MGVGPAQRYQSVRFEGYIVVNSKLPTPTRQPRWNEALVFTIYRRLWRSRRHSGGTD